MKTAESADFQQDLECIQAAMDAGGSWNVGQAEAFCRRWAGQQYENFTVVSWLLPKAIRQDFYNIYCYCRWSDDLGDEIADDALSLRLLDEWEAELELCWTGTPRHPILVALQSTVQQHELTKQYFLDLLDAFRQDRRVARYADSELLLDYCTRSANPVGRILLELAGAADAESLLLSDEVCTGLQLANFCQDMSRDAAIGRIYAPQDLWRKFDVTEEMILQRRPTNELRAMLAEWVGNTHGFFERGEPLIGRVPKWLALDVELFLRGGQAILREIEAQQFDVWTSRPIVSKWRKIRLLVSAWCKPRRNPRKVS